MKMKKLISFALTLCLLLCASGALADYTPVILTHVVDPDSDRGIVPTPPGEDGKYPLNPVIEGESGTTGLPSSGTYIPILVNIANLTSHIPPWGIAEADLVYELPIINYTGTRSMALYTEVFPEEVGPVRSARVLHADLRQEWDAAWVFEGMQEAEGTNVNVRLRELGVSRNPDDTIIYNQGDSKKWTQGFRSPYNIDPNNFSVRLNRIAEIAVESGHEFHQRPFLFTDERPQTGDEATKVNVIYGEASWNCDTYYTYDAETNKYMRYVPAKGNYVDIHDPDTQLGYENLIFQWTELKFYEYNWQRPILPNVVGEGNADFFMGGKHISGYWVRTDINERTVFFDTDGNEIKLQRGHSWIAITSNHTTLSYE